MPKSNYRPSGLHIVGALILIGMELLWLTLLR